LARRVRRDEKIRAAFGMNILVVYVERRDLGTK
jgi:hypothetical protein